MGEEVRCACGGEECQIRIWLTQDGLWFQDPDGKQSLMYLDMNTAHRLIQELKEWVMKHVDQWPERY